MVLLLDPGKLTQLLELVIESSSSEDMTVSPPSSPSNHNLGAEELNDASLFFLLLIECVLCPLAPSDMHDLSPGESWLDDLHIFDASPEMKRLEGSSLIRVPVSSFAKDLGSLLYWRQRGRRLSL